MSSRHSEHPYLGPGIVLGLGIGGFFDGIVFHQLLGWHHLLSSTSRWPVTTPHGLQVNLRADGLFHAGTWVVTLIGLGWLWRVSSQPHWPWATTGFIGALLIGWGLFNLGEDLLDHQLLGLHHVRPGPYQLAWDLGYLAWGAAMVLLSWALLEWSRRGRTA